MFEQELWYVKEEEVEEEEEEEEEESFSLESLPEDCESEESYCEDCQECGRESQELPTHHVSKRRSLEDRRCRRRLFAPYSLQDKGRSPCCAGRRRDSEAEALPWGRGSPPWCPPLESWVRDVGAICQSSWQLQQAGSSRTLSHPSFQTFFTAVSTSNNSHPLPGDQTEPQMSGGPLPLVDCSGFFYTDPTLPPGYRIYSCLSASSQEILRSLPLNTPAPIMCTQPAASLSCRWLTEQEYGAVTALLTLAPSSSLAPESAQSGGTGTPPPSQ